jgi:acyl-CoA thioester hydrolase
VPVETTIQIRWGDMDAMGHVNNATFLAYLETAREPFFEQVVGDELMRFVLRRVEIDYLSQLTYGDREAVVSVELAGVGTTSLRTHERMTVAGSGRVVAEARAVIVHLDESGTSAAPLPESLRVRLARALPAEAAR